MLFADILFTLWSLSKNPQPQIIYHFQHLTRVLHKHFYHHCRITSVPRTASETFSNFILSRVCIFEDKDKAY